MNDDDNWTWLFEFGIIEETESLKWNWIIEMDKRGNSGE